MHLSLATLRRRASLSLVGVAACAAAGLAATAAAPAGAGTAGSADGARIVDVPVSFQVHNVNRSKVPCPTDGKTYTVRGHLVGSAAALATPRAQRAATLYLHGLSFGEFFWNFDAVPGYDYAQKQAQAGQVSVIVDRLGYNSSGKPPGMAICVGSRADIAHQIVQDLRSGSYTTSGHQARRFGLVYLAGHSYGGQIAEVEAYSFGDVDGIVVISYTDVGQTALLRKNARYAAKVCASGGLPVTPHGPGGYAPFGPPSGAPAALFHDVAPAVLKATLPMLTLDPCGDGTYFKKATRTDLRLVHEITVPVLLIQGGADALFDAAAQQQQAALFTGSSDVRTVIIPNTAHAITLERTRNQFAHKVAITLRSFERTAG